MEKIKTIMRVFNKNNLQLEVSNFVFFLHYDREWVKTDLFYTNLTSTLQNILAKRRVECYSFELHF